MTTLTESDRDQLVERLKAVRERNHNNKNKRSYNSKMRELMMRINFHYDMRIKAVDLLKKTVIGSEPINSFQHACTENIIANSNFDRRTLNYDSYGKSPDEHDDALSVVFWDLYHLPREMALQRLDIIPTEMSGSE